jgi:hypothetical protein
MPKKTNNIMQYFVKEKPYIVMGPNYLILKVFLFLGWTSCKTDNIKDSTVFFPLASLNNKKNNMHKTHLL